MPGRQLEDLLAPATNPQRPHPALSSAPRIVGFFYEHDRGTENLRTLLAPVVAKMTPITDDQINVVAEIFRRIDARRARNDRIGPAES